MNGNQPLNVHRYRETISLASEIPSKNEKTLCNIVRGTIKMNSS